MPWYRKRVKRDVLVIILVATVSLAIGSLADVANPAYPEARDHAERIDATWRSISQRGLDPEKAATTAGLRAHTSEVEGQSRVVLTHPEPTAEGACYAIRFGPGIVTRAGTLASPSPGCTPQTSGLFETAGSWSQVLPSERITPIWYVPVLVVLVALGIGAATDIPLALLTGRRSK